MSTSTFVGVVHGKRIDLQAEPHLPEGQVVVLTMHPVSSDKSTDLPGDGIRRSAGGWSDDEQGLDEFLAWNRQQRKSGRQEL